MEGTLPIEEGEDMVYSLSKDKAAGDAASEINDLTEYKESKL